MNNKLLTSFALVFSLLIGWLLFSSSALAQSPSPTATTSAELRQAIRERIEETLQEEDISPLYMGYIGVIKQVGSATFSFVDPLGYERTVQLLSNADLVEDGSNIKLDDLVVGNGVTVIGNPLDELVIEAKRIIMSNNDFSETRRVHLGTIVEIPRGELVFQPRGQNDQAVWNRGSQVTYEDSLGAEITLSQVEANQAALVVTEEDEDGERFVKKVHLLVSLNEVEE